MMWCLISFSYLFSIKSIYAKGHILNQKDKQNPTGILYTFKTAAICLHLIYFNQPYEENWKVLYTGDVKQSSPSSLLLLLPSSSLPAPSVPRDNPRGSPTMLLRSWNTVFGSELGTAAEPVPKKRGTLQGTMSTERKLSSDFRLHLSYTRCHRLAT